MALVMINIAITSLYEQCIRDNEHSGVYFTGVFPLIGVIETVNLFIIIRFIIIINALL